MGGAKGIRANYASDIKAIKNEVDVPVIGIIKAVYEEVMFTLHLLSKKSKNFLKQAARLLHLTQQSVNARTAKRLKILLNIFVKTPPMLKLWRTALILKRQSVPTNSDLTT